MSDVADGFTIEKRIMELFKKVVRSNDQLSVFNNSFVFSEIGSSGHIYHKYFIDLKATAQKNDDSDVSPHIGILNFSPRDITHLSLGTNRLRGSSEVPMFLNVYNSAWRSYDTSRRMGINVSKKVSIKGYCLNYIDVKKYIADCSNTRNRNYYNEDKYQINQFYFVTARNILLAITAIDGQLLIRRQALEKLVAQNNETLMLEVLENVLMCHYKIVQKYMSLNLSEYKQDLADSVFDISKLKVIDATAADIANDSVMREFKQEVKRQINALMSNSIFGADDNYSYQHLLNSVLEKRKKFEQSLYEDAFKKGMQIGLKLEMLGWHACTPTFPDHTNMTDMWWSKEVDIKPDSFMKNQCRYLIEAKYQKYYKITKLYINQDGVMRCEGKHPNVSGTRVCMGDLKVSFVDDLSTLKQTFEQIETLLDMINYDSAYQRTHEDEFLKYGTLDNVYAANNTAPKDKKKIASGIREVSFNDDNDEEEEEIIEDEDEKLKELTVLDNEEIKIIENIDFTESQRTDIANGLVKQIKSNTSESDSVLENVSSNFYEVENRIAGNVAFVDGDGHLIRVNNETVAVPVTNAQFSLGDSNIVNRLSDANITVPVANQQVQQ